MNIMIIIISIIIIIMAPCARSRAPGRAVRAGEGGVRRRAAGPPRGERATLGAEGEAAWKYVRT